MGEAKASQFHCVQANFAPGQEKLLQKPLWWLGVLRFRSDEDGDVRVGVFPQREEILIRGAGFRSVTLRGVRTGKSQDKEQANSLRNNRWISGSV